MKKVMILAGCLIAFALIGIMFGIPQLNDATAKETAARLANTPLPEQTEYIESAYRAGKLVGNGNGMQYFGAILIKSELSLKDLKKYYKSYATDSWEYNVERQLDKNIKIVEHGQLSFRTDIPSDDYYIVYSWGSSNGALREFDIRGH